ncbi:MAG TPA: transporter substrate-binding domain-containing protein [Bacillota bacterium]|nr:transporter substrate-binding domain-containing protein [Bacillota bacterium]
MKIEKLRWFGIGLLFFGCCWLLYGALNKKSGYIVAVVGNTVYAEKARKFGKVAAVKLYEDNYQAFNAIVGGRATTVITSRLVGLNLIKEQKRFRTIQMAGDLLYQEMAAVAFNRDEDALRQAVNRGLAEIMKNGIYAEISKRYFGLNVIKGLSMDSTYPNDPSAWDNSWKKRQQVNELRVAVSGTNPPFSFLNERGELSGFDVELAWAVCIQLGIRYFTPVMVSSSKMIKGLQDGQFDVIWDSMRVTEDNLALVDFSNPYYLNGAQLFVKQGSPITGPEILEPSLLSEGPPTGKPGKTEFLD